MVQAVGFAPTRPKSQPSEDCVFTLSPRLHGGDGGIRTHTVRALNASSPAVGLHPHVVGTPGGSRTHTPEGIRS
jgi:hypothetical protein